LKDSPNKPVVVLGAGGHAKVIAESLSHAGREILGFLTPEAEPGTPFLGSSILGGDDAIEKYSPSEIDLVNGVGALPQQDLRWRLALEMRELGYRFITVVHPSAIVSPETHLEEGVQLMAGTIVQTGTRMGQDTILNTGAIVDHDCLIDENCHLAPGVVCSGGVRIGRGVHIGTGSVLIQNVTIGCGSILAAGSAIYRDVPEKVMFKQGRQEKLEVIES
jgi:UDP-perosamine 4-acetyltransferase